MKSKIFGLVLLITSMCTAQDFEFFVRFTDKAGSLHSLGDPTTFLSSKSIQRRANQSIDLEENDLPVSQDYVDSLVSYGVSVYHTSRWLNGVIARGDSTVISGLEAKPYVLDVLAIGNSLASRSSVSSKFNVPGTKGYGPAANQIEMLGADLLHGEGYLGSGVTIAVIDDGFPNVGTGAAFQDMINENRVKFTYDVHERITNVYANDNHGTYVLSTIVGIPSDTIGIAPGADIMLFRTEVLEFEQPLEEYYWIIAAEMADSAGADILTTSLGYSDFDAPWAAHVYADLDGATVPMTIAADIAAAKGMLVVNSAGNEGSVAWNYILVPADGDSVLTVGAVNSSENYVSFSSEGPSADGRIKPEVSCKGQSVTVSNGSGTTNANGTSFAAPTMSGYAALLWQKNPSLTAIELRELLMEMGDQSTTPDNFKGYGIPKYQIVSSTETVVDFEGLNLIGQTYSLTDLNGRVLATGRFENLEGLALRTGVYILQFEEVSYRIALTQ